MEDITQFAAGFFVGSAIMVAVGVLAVLTGSTALLAGLVPLGIAVATVYAGAGLISEAPEPAPRLHPRHRQR